MADHKECKHYEGCCYRNDIGCCPNWCAQFKHKDDVRVVRCKDCKHWVYTYDGMGDCTNARFHLDGCADPTMEHDGYCSNGERRTDG